MVIDTNVALHQLDLLSHAAVTDVVVLSVVLEECRARSKAGVFGPSRMCRPGTRVGIQPTANMLSRLLSECTLPHGMYSSPPGPATPSRPPPHRTQVGLPLQVHFEPFGGPRGYCYCSPRHRMLCNSRHEGSRCKCVG